MVRGLVPFALAAALLAGCSARGLAPAPAGNVSDRVPSAFRHAPSGSKIAHVVFVIQENRSFNYLFLGFPGALTQPYGYDQKGDTVALHRETLATPWDIDHSLTAFKAVEDGGKYDGWNAQNACCDKIPKNFAYAYAPRSEVKPYWDLAAEYVLADHMFASNLDGSFVAHQYAIAAFAGSTVDFPTGAWGCEGGPGDTVPTITRHRTYGPAVAPCFENPTLGDEADAAGVSWRYYAPAPAADGGVWSAYQAIGHIYNGPDWSGDVISPPAQFLQDVAAGTLADITWIVPTGPTSDHAGLGFASKNGPAWVASVVDAVGNSPFWNSTAIFIMWDEWGGWFDPVAPIRKDYDGLGFRVPLLVVSPYAKPAYVAHKEYETASVLRFIEDNFGLGQLAAADTRAADPAPDVFDFSASPRPFKTIAGARPAAYWQRQPATARLFGRGSPAGGD